MPKRCARQFVKLFYKTTVRIIAICQIPFVVNVRMNNINGESNLTTDFADFIVFVNLNLCNGNNEMQPSSVKSAKSVVINLWKLSYSSIS